MSHPIESGCWPEVTREVAQTVPQAGLDFEMAEHLVGSREMAVLSLFGDVAPSNQFLLRRIGEIKALDLC